MSFPGSRMGIQNYADIYLKLNLKLLTMYYNMPSPTFLDKNPESAQYPEPFQGGNDFRLFPRLASWRGYPCLSPGSRARETDIQVARKKKSYDGYGGKCREVKYPARKKDMGRQGMDRVAAGAGMAWKIQWKMKCRNVT